MYVSTTSHFLISFLIGTAVPSKNFLLEKILYGFEVPQYTNNMNAKSALYAQECQFSIVGLVTGSAMNIVNISVA